MKEEMLQKVKELRDKGVARKEIAKQLGIGKTTVDRAITKLDQIAAEEAARQSANQGITEDRLREIIREEISQKDDTDTSKLPFVLKSGKGTEMITPEGIMQFYLLGDGDTGAAMLKGMMLLRAAQLMVMNDVEIMKGQAEAQAAAIKPILDIMEKARVDMDAAAERARASTEDVAQAAAAGAAARAAMHIDEKFEQLKQQRADIATVQDPMKGLMARTMETMMNRVTGMMLGGQVPPTPGLVDERVQK